MHTIADFLTCPVTSNMYYSLLQTLLHSGYNGSMNEALCNRLLLNIREGHLPTIETLLEYNAHNTIWLNEFVCSHRVDLLSALCELISSADLPQRIVMYTVASRIMVDGSGNEIENASLEFFKRSTDSEVRTLRGNSDRQRISAEGSSGILALAKIFNSVERYSFFVDEAMEYFLTALQEWNWGEEVCEMLFPSLHSAFANSCTQDQVQHLMILVMSFVCSQMEAIYERYIGVELSLKSFSDEMKHFVWCLMQMTGLAANFLRMHKLESVVTNQTRADMFSVGLNLIIDICNQDLLIFPDFGYVLLARLMLEYHPVPSLNSVVWKDSTGLFQLSITFKQIVDTMANGVYAKIQRKTLKGLELLFALALLTYETNCLESFDVIKHLIPTQIESFFNLLLNITDPVTQNRSVQSMVGLMCYSYVIDSSTVPETHLSHPFYVDLFAGFVDSHFQTMKPYDIAAYILFRMMDKYEIPLDEAQLDQIALIQYALQCDESDNELIQAILPLTHRVQLRYFLTE